MPPVEVMAEPAEAMPTSAPGSVKIGGEGDRSAPTASRTRPADPLPGACEFGISRRVFAPRVTLGDGGHCCIGCQGRPAYDQNLPLDMPLDRVPTLDS